MSAHHAVIISYYGDKGKSWHAISLHFFAFRRNSAMRNKRNPVTGKLNVSCSLWLLTKAFGAIIALWAFETALDALLGTTARYVIVVLLCLIASVFVISCKTVGDKMIETADNRLPAWASKMMHDSIADFLTSKQSDSESRH